MSLLRLILTFLCALLLSSTAHAVCVGYYYGAAASECPPERIRAGLLTQINYAFAEIDPDTWTLTLADPVRDRKNLAGLRALRQENPELKIVLTAGGWDGSVWFSDTASSKTRRETFAKSCAALVREEDLDGIDINWEYPVSGGTAGTHHRSADRENFTLLLQAVRGELDLLGDGYVLTATGAAETGFLKKIEPSAAADVTDYIFLMAYDFSGPWETRTGFNAPLDSIRKSAGAYLQAGIPAEKLVLGMPLYGYRYEGVNGSSGGLNSPFKSAASITYDAVLNKYLPAFSVQRSPSAQVPYLYQDGVFLSYDDPESIAAKAAFAREAGLAGIGFWELSQDPGGTLLASATAAFAGRAFRDVAPGVWYADAAEEVFRVGWMTGTAEGIFSPDAPVTRGMFAAILYRMEGEPAAAGASFPDVQPDNYYAAAAAWAAENGIVKGYADGSFRPDKAVTREQLAAMLQRYAVYRGYDVSAVDSLEGFQDAEQVSGYARDAVSWAAAEGLLRGRTKDLLVPGGTVSRSETAVILIRLAEKILK
ncbi:MAG: S-layer homology domain-containing protein [Oscillospiraceae bacterium]|nr:S-layer homology domain-containing protein [Oscillospiraceae bacterium]